jgi:MFS family permease
MLGPAVAGIALKLAGYSAAFWINGASFFVVILSLLAVRSHQAESKHRSGRGQFRETIQFLARQPRMIDLLIFAALVTFFGLSIFNILPSVADHVLNGDSQTFGLLLGSSGAGALILTLILLPLSQASKRVGRIVVGAAVWMSMFFLLFSRSTWLPLSMAAIFFVSLGAPLVLTTGLGVLQMMAPMEMRARIISIFNMLAFGLQPLASLVIGYSAEYFGAPVAILVNAMCMLTGAALLFFFRNGLRQWELHSTVRPIMSSQKAE